jgi:hypothetical protein
MPLRNDQNPKMSAKNSNSNIVVLNFITYIDNLKFSFYLYELSKQEAKRRCQTFLSCLEYKLLNFAIRTEKVVL